MKISETTITINPKPTAFANSPEHNRSAGLLLGRLWATRDHAQMAQLTSWAIDTRSAAMLGSAHPGVLTDAVHKHLETLDKLVAAKPVAAKREKTGKALDKRQAAAESDIEVAEQTIAELQQTVAEKRRDLAGVAAERKALTEACTLIDNTEGAGPDGNFISAAWAYVQETGR